MSYQSGNQFNFLQRLHFWPTGIQDLDKFKIEGSAYATSGTTGDLNYWNKEFVKKYEQFDSPSGSFKL